MAVKRQNWKETRQERIQVLGNIFHTNKIPIVEQTSHENNPLDFLHYLNNCFYFIGYDDEDDSDIVYDEHIENERVVKTELIEADDDAN